MDVSIYQLLQICKIYANSSLRLQTNFFQPIFSKTLRNPNPTVLLQAVDNMVLTICETANGLMARTLMATSSIWCAISCPWRVPSIRVSSTRILTYLQANQTNNSIYKRSTQPCATYHHQFCWAHNFFFFKILNYTYILSIQNNIGSLLIITQILLLTSSIIKVAIKMLRVKKNSHLHHDIMVNLRNNYT